MSKRAFLATVVLMWLTTATASIICNDAAMSEPVLIDPTSRYYGDINNYGERDMPMISVISKTLLDIS